MPPYLLGSHVTLEQKWEVIIAGEDTSAWNGDWSQCEYFFEPQFVSRLKPHTKCSLLFPEN